MTSIQGTGQSGQIQYHHEPLVTGQADPSVRPHLEALENSFLERLDDLNTQIGRSNDPGEKLQLQEEMRSLEGQFDRIRSHPQAGGCAGPALPMDIGDLIADMRASIARSYENFGTASLPPQSFCGTEVRTPLARDLIESMIPDNRSILNRLPDAIKNSNLQGLLERIGAGTQIGSKIQLPETPPGSAASGTTTASSTAASAAPDGAASSSSAASAQKSAETATTSETTEASETSAASGAEQTSSSEGVSGSKDGDGSIDPREMLELFNEDPQAFYDSLQDIKNPEERMMHMNMVQTELQRINQMFSMMSQFSQAIHDTHKAVINNLRV